MNDLEVAEDIAENAQYTRDSLAGKRVRVVRAIVYEGEGAAVLKQLAGSLPVGTKEVRKGTLTITVSQGEIEIIPDPERIHVEQIDPSELVGIAFSDDGSGGWVVMQRTYDDHGDPAEVEPVGDRHGPIVYVDILDAAEVLKTGTVWKHDMGEGEPDPSDDSTGRE